LNTNPVFKLGLQLLLSCARHRIVLSLTIALGSSPLSTNPSLVFQSLECRIEGALSDLQHIFGYLLNALRGTPAMHGLKGQRAQDKQVERSQEQVGT